MLIKLRFRLPDVFLGMLFAVAVFLIGMAFSGSYRQANDNGPSNYQTETENKNVSAEERLADYTLALDGLTLVLVVATIGLGIVSYVGIRNQTKDTRVLRRAYLGTEVRGLRVINGNVIAHVAFANRGNLPARKIRNAVKIGWSGDGNKEDFEKVEALDPGTIILLPKTQTERGTGSLSSSDLAHYHSGKGYVYVWGRVEYDDGFGGKPRWLIYCHRYNLSRPQTPRITTTATSAPTARPIETKNGRRSLHSPQLPRYRLRYPRQNFQQLIPISPGYLSKDGGEANKLGLRAERKDRHGFAAYRPRYR